MNHMAKSPKDRLARGGDVQVKPHSELIPYPTRDNNMRLEGGTGIPACVSDSTDKNVCATLERDNAKERGRPTRDAWLVGCPPSPS
jgi:hypothetical protein